jgi:hypothetical protein
VPVIIGNSTRVSIAFNNATTVTDGIVSVEWNIGTQPNRLYTLGMGSAQCGVKEFATVRQAQVNVSFSIYGGVTPQLSTCATAVCANSPASAVVTVVPGICAAQGAPPVDTFNHQVFINSYSYSKDRVGMGTEQWQGSAYVSSSVVKVGNCNEYCEPEPTYVVLGIAEGTIEGETQDLTALQNVVGAQFRDDACIVTSARASVQASQTSIGEYMFTRHGTFKSIGGSTFWAPGVVGKASITLNLQPIYLAA